MPRCNTQAMQWYLDDISSQVSSDAHAVLLLDQAGWQPRKQRHTAKRIFERLRDEHGFGGGYAIVKDYVRREPCMSDCKPGPVTITQRARVLDVTPDSGDDVQGVGVVD